MDKGGSTGQEKLVLTEALSRFCDVEMPARNLSGETRRGYTYDLSEWVASTPPSSPVSALSTDVISRYLSALDERGLKGSTRHRKVAAIKTFLRFLEREGQLPTDFSTRISWPEVQRDEPRALSVPEYTALLREAGHHPRDAAILELLLQTGIRLSELTALTVEDVSLPAKPSLDPVNGYGLLRVVRKGRRLQELILNYKACRALKAYLRVRPAAATSALFLTKYSEPITGRSVQKLMKKYATAAGVGWAHVHTLRTTHITEHIARRTDIKTVQGNAGHASLATTNFYARYVKEAQIRAMQENAL
jgi:site-specific recombinase XerD